MNEKTARRIVYERSGGRCERCGMARAAEWHHRRNRSQGGQWTPSNGLHLCTPCHHWVTVHPAESYDEGWMLRAGSPPESTPVKTWRGYLAPDDEGGWTNLGHEKPILEHSAGCSVWTVDLCDCGGIA